LISRIESQLHEGEEGKYILLLLHEFRMNYTKEKRATTGGCPYNSRFTVNGLQKRTCHCERSRLREKVIIGGFDTLNDYEIVELLLTLGTPRKDCKEAAKIVIKKFGSLNDILSTDEEQLLKIEGIGKHNIFGIKLAKEILKSFHKRSITINESPVYPREVIKKVFLYNATSIIIAHNHPSGDVTPSKGDILVTEKLKDICETMNISMLDHIIISPPRIHE
jgi:DNA repair protein RadC